MREGPALLRLARRLPFRRRSTAATPGFAGATRIREISRLDPAATLRLLGSRPEGLTEAEVEARLAATGPNQIAQEGRKPILAELATRAKNPLNLLLLSLAAIS